MTQEKEYPFKRNPQPLSRNSEIRLQQMQIIAANPTDQQKADVLGVIEREVLRDYRQGHSDLYLDRDHAERVKDIFFANLPTVLASRKVIAAEMTAVRNELSRPGGDSTSIREARKSLREARSFKRETDRITKDYDLILREARVKVDPEHAPLTTLERTRLRLYELQKRVAEPGLQLGKNRLQLLIESGSASLRNVAERERTRLKDISGSIMQGAKGIFNRTAPLVDFVSGQEERIRTTGQQVQTRIAEEIKEAAGKGRPILNPALRSMNSDRENIKRHVAILASKFTQATKEKAMPVVDKTVLESMRVFGKNILNTVHDKTKGAWDFFKKQIEKMISQANGARQRLNKFLDNNLGPIGTRFRVLSSSLSFKAATINEDAKWWLEDRGYDAKEGLIRTSEWIDEHEGQVTEAVEAVRAYWNAHAVKRWEEMGLKKKEIQERVRLMNAISSASLKNAAEKMKATPHELAKGGKLAGKGMLRAGSFAGGATLAAWDGLSLVGVKAGAETFKFLGQHRKLRMGLAVGAPLAFVLLSNPHMIDNITGFLQGLGGLNLAAATVSGVDLASNLPSVDGGTGIVSSGNYSSTVDIFSINTADMGNQIVASDPSYHIINAPTGGGEVTVFDSSSFDSSALNAGVDTLSTSDGMNNSLSSVNIAELAAKVQPGQPIGIQIAELAKGIPGDTQENIRKLFEKVWEVDGWNFESTSRAILDGMGGPYTDTQIRFAQRAADAADLIKRDPSSATQQLYEYATHYWRPVPR